MRRVDGRALDRERGELIFVYAISTIAYVVGNVTGHLVSACGYDRSARYVDYCALGFPETATNSRGGFATDSRYLPAGDRNPHCVSIPKLVAVSVADSCATLSAGRLDLAACDRHPMSVCAISATDARAVLIAIRHDLSARHGYRSASIPVPAADARRIPSAGRLDLAAGDSHSPLLRNFVLSKFFAERSAADARAARAACRADVSADYFDRPVALEVSAADGCSLVGAFCRQDGRGQDVFVIRDDRHDVHVVRHNDDTAVPVIFLLYAFDRVRVVIDVAEVGDDHVGVDVRYRERRRVGDMDRGGARPRAGERVLASKRHDDGDVGRDLDRRGIYRGRGQHEVRDRHRNVARAVDEHLARRVRAAHHAAVVRDGKRMAFDVVRPALAESQRDVLAVHRHADGPRLRLGVGAIHHGPVGNAAEGEVVGAVGKPNVDLALVVRLHARQQIAVIIGHHRADVEVRPARLDRHAVDRIAREVLGLFRDSVRCGVERPAVDRRVAGGIGIALTALADVRPVVDTARDDRTAELPIRPRPAPPSAADASSLAAAGRAHDAVRDHHASDRAGAVSAADASTVIAARCRHRAAIDVHRKTVLSVGASDAGCGRSARRDDLAGGDGERRGASVCAP